MYEIRMKNLMLNDYNSFSMDKISKQVAVQKTGLVMQW